MNYLDVLQAAGEGATQAPWYGAHFANSLSSCDCRYVLSDIYLGSICDISKRTNDEYGGNDSPPEDEAVGNYRFITLSRNVWRELVAVARAAEAFAMDQDAMNYLRADPEDCWSASLVSINEARHRLIQTVEEHKEARDG